MRDHFTKHQYAKPKQATMHKRRVYQNKNPKCFFFFFFQPSRSQKIKVIQLLTVTQDITLDLAGINPGNEVLHVARNQESRIIDDLRTNTDMALLNESSSLARISQHSITYMLNSEPSPHSATYSFDSLNHARAHHEDGQSATAQRGNCYFALDPRQTGALLAGLL